MTRSSTRRRFLGASTAALGAAALGAGARRRKPNLLVLWTDEQRADTMAAYGNTRIHAPNLNRLAAESFVLRNAYVTQPVCTPSRSTVMTGLWPHTSGCTANNVPLPADVPCLPELLADPGDMMGSHHMVEKCVMYQEAVLVPWLMRVPWLGRKQHMVPNPVSHIDLVPTILGLMGSRAGEGLPGHSLVPLLEGGKPADDHVLIEWSPGQGARRHSKGTRLATPAEIQRVANDHTRTVISPDGWKLCLSTLDKCQLFNLNADPGETINLFDSGRHADAIARLTEKIRHWQETVRDKAKV